MAFAYLMSVMFAASVSAHAQSGWNNRLRSSLEQLDARYPGQLGVVVKDLRTGETLSYRGEETWYLASGTKVVIAAELLRQADEGLLTLEQTVELKKEDMLDGAGTTNLHPVGARLSLRYLLEQMLIHSDNTASDLILRQIGIANVNALAKKLSRGGFGVITSLGDVRRYIYSELHASAFRLRNNDFLELKKAENTKKLLQLRKLLNLGDGDLKLQNVDEAYYAYYARGFNSASLIGYTELLNQLATGTVLKPASSRLLLEIMSRVATGGARIKAGLPATVSYAGKTGTQIKRVCDFGVISEGDKPLALVSACARGFGSVPEAEEALKRIGQSIAKSGVLEKPVAEKPTAEKQAGAK